MAGSGGAGKALHGWRWHAGWVWLGQAGTVRTGRPVWVRRDGVRSGRAGVVSHGCGKSGLVRWRLVRFGEAGPEGSISCGPVR